jgi:hypothetical protein
VTWVVVTQASYDAWEATADPEQDSDLRANVLAWVLDLQNTGPPPAGVFDPFRGTFFAQVANTDIWIEYLVLPYLCPPVIAIRGYR